MPALAVVGHVEWVDFLSVPHLPTLGQITPAQRIRTNAGGGAVVAAVVLARLGAEVDFYGAVGSDGFGDRAVEELEAAGIRTHVTRRPGPTRQVITFLDAGGERSIVTIGERIAASGDDDLDWERLDRCDGAYFTAGDRGALHAARRARYLVSTPRLAETLGTVDVDLDALVLSGDDATERRWGAALAGHARLEVVTEGAAGGYWIDGRSGGSGGSVGSGGSAGSGGPGGDARSAPDVSASGGRWHPVPAPGPIIDAYGAGDSFAAGFTYGLATEGDPAIAARIGAECGARALTHPGGP